MTPDGKRFWMQGLCVDSLQWNAQGERTVQSVQVAIDSWKANTIRLPVIDSFWYGKGVQGQPQSDGGVGYRAVIDSAIESAAARGAYVVLDLHLFRAPESAQLQFWKDVAKKYKNNPAVVFELFNEPHDISWEVWRNGGLVTDKQEPKPGVAVENTEKLHSFQAIGMQQLVDVVRETGAKNVIVAGTLDWSYDLSGLLKGFALKDPTGNGIMYSVHIYPWKKNWQGSFLDAAENYSLFVGEEGNLRSWEDFSFIPVNMRSEKVGLNSPFPADLLGMIQKYKLNWTGFSFHPTCGPNAITDWNYTPSPFWGIFVKEALSGKHFEMKNLR